MEAIEYGLSNLISSLWMTDIHVENQWEAIYPTNTPCLFTFGHNLSSCVIWIVWDFLSLDLSKKNRTVPAVCLIVTVLVNSMNGNGQVSSLQRKGIAANLHQPFINFTVLKYQIKQRFYSLPFVVTSIVNVI